MPETVEVQTALLLALRDAAADARLPLLAANLTSWYAAPAADVERSASFYILLSVLLCDLSFPRCHRGGTVHCHVCKVSCKLCSTRSFATISQDLWVCAG